MSFLKCSVTQCVHNETGKCCLESIKVAGDNASSSPETSCKSYQKRGEGAMNYVSHGAPGAETHIACEATKCAYNTNRKCEADSVTITKCGSSSEDRCECTQCETYRHQ